MKAGRERSGFALIVTLVLMALVVVVVVAYLGNSRSDRATSSTYANRLRAKMIGDSALGAATKLLYDNTKYGNYITAMPAPSPSPAPHYTEIYRPADPANPLTHPLKADDYLRLDDAAGEILVSRATTAAAPLPAVDPRPTPETIPTPLAAAAPFALSAPNPTLSASNSFDFNQIVRVGNNDAARLVDADGQPAFGEWVRVRNSAGELIGRYAFFVEDESMKLNVNVAGNDFAAAAANPNLRVNDLVAIPAPSPASQVQEIDPAALLVAANRKAANTELMGLGAPGARLASKSTLGLLGHWTSTDTYGHLLTAVSRDDNTTAKGWQRLDLNALVAGAATNAAKVAVATRIANWIRDAWTGPTAVTALQYHQLYNDNRLRLQIAANIVDYIDQDDVPTDMGDVVPDGGYPDAVPVIGIEKIPYAQAVEVVYEASNSTCPSPVVPGTYTANIRMKLRFRFFNLFDSSIDPRDHIGRIEVSGVPVVSKNGTTVFDVEGQKVTAAIGDLRLPNGGGSCGSAGVCSVPPGTDGSSTSGAKTVETDWLQSQAVTFTVIGNDSKPRLLSGKISVKVFGKNGERLDDTSIVTNLNDTGYRNNNGNSVKDFLTDATSTVGPLQIASINVVYGPSYETGDPRYRGRLVNDRWRSLDRTDATVAAPPADPDRVTAYTDRAEMNCRSFGVDWFDESGDRPLAYIRNGAMTNIGELGNIAATEYPWRTLYLQHPERPANTTQAGPKDDIPLRRSQSQDHVLIDLFRAGGTLTRTGAININTQQQFSQPGATAKTSPLHSLFLGIPVGAAAPTQLTEAAPAAAASPADRLSTNVNVLVSSMTVAPAANQAAGTAPHDYRIASVASKRVALPGETATPDNNPPRPYFHPGELAATLSRLLSASEASDTGATTSRSKVVYSAMRPNPQSTTTNQNYRRDFHVEQAFRAVSNSITTRGNVFRVLYVGQAIKDVDKNGVVRAPDEIRAEYLGEAFVERHPVFVPEPANADAVKTSDSTYTVLAQRVITE